jgi:hypothetical protein
MDKIYFLLFLDDSVGLKQFLNLPVIIKIIVITIRINDNIGTKIIVISRLALKIQYME